METSSENTPWEPGIGYVSEQYEGRMVTVACFENGKLHFRKIPFVFIQRYRRDGGIVMSHGIPDSRSSPC